MTNPAGKSGSVTIDGADVLPTGLLPEINSRRGAPSASSAASSNPLREGGEANSKGTPMVENRVSSAYRWRFCWLGSPSRVMRT